jgi:nucleotide-binding universal stress UspA family protein
MTHGPFDEILVPLDGSPAAERGLGPALALARRADVPVRLLSRVFPGDADERLAYMAGVAERLPTGVDVDLRVVERDSIPDAIVDGLGPSTLVCMSSHGRGGIARGVIGSVTEALLRIIGRPTLVVGPYAGTDATFAGRVVACIDGSQESERTLGPARQWAAALDLPLGLVQVVDPRPDQPETPPEDVESADLADVARRVGGVPSWDVLHGTSPARALADLTTSELDPVAMLVMATHGRTGWHRLRLGSVTTATVHSARVPILVVPAAAHSTPDAADRRPDLVTVARRAPDDRAATQPAGGPS